MAKAVCDGMNGAQVRPDRQYRLDQRPGRPIWPGQLCRRQVGHPRLHQGARPGRRARRHHRQRDRARLYRHRDGRRGAARTCSRRSSPRSRSAGSARPRRSPAASPSSARRMPASSPARRCRSTAASTCIDGSAASACATGPVKRSMMIAGHATSISLEPVFWDALRERPRRRGLPLNALVARIDAERIDAPDPPNLASAIRVWLFDVRAIAAADSRRSSAPAAPAPGWRSGRASARW